MSTDNWRALLVAANVQVFGVYSFRIDVSTRRSFTHLIESIAVALKGLPYVINKVLVSVCTLVLRRFKYSFKSTHLTFCYGMLYSGNCPISFLVLNV